VILLALVYDQANCRIDFILNRGALFDI